MASLCGGVNEKGPIALISGYSVSSWWKCWEGIRSCGLVGGGASLGFEFAIPG